MEEWPNIADRDTVGKRWSFVRLAIILVVFPISLVYLVPTLEMVRALYAGNRSYWFTFWLLAVFLEWLTLAVVLTTYRDRRGALEKIGFPLQLSRRDKLLAGIILLVTVVFAVIGSGGDQSFLRRLPAGLQMFIPPSDLSARVFWVFAALTAAVCEETLWRGVAITELRARTGSTPVAVLVSSLSFVFFHGGFQQGAVVFAYRMAVTLVLASLYWRSRDLRLVILIHFLMDAVALAAIQID